MRMPVSILHALLPVMMASLVTACASDRGDAAGDGLGSGTDEGGASTHGDEGTTGEPDGSDTGTGEPEACEEPWADLAPLYPPGLSVEPIVTVRDDGVIVTRGAGRVRGRHELENEHNQYLPLYFENRSYAFVIEDHVAAGEDRIVISYFPEAPVSTFGSTTNLRAWKVFGDGNVFHHNVSMDTIDLQHQVEILEGNAREGRAMQVGDTLEFEFGIFIAGNDPADPGAVEGRTAYYTDTFRYRVGQGGLHPRNEDPSGLLGPAPDHALAGDTTIPYLQAEVELSYSQMALDMQPEHVQPFLEGRRLFHTDFGTGEHGEPGNPALPEQAGKLGPLFNVTACSACHDHNGRGAPPEVGVPLTTMAVKLYGDDALGTQLQPQEAELAIAGWEAHEDQLADGTTVELVRPLYAGADPAWAYSPRVARQLTGLGLLEAIGEEQILARATVEGCDDDGGLSGRAMLVPDPVDGTLKLGRLGWKAEKIGVRHQLADALLQDMGVTTSVFPEPGGGAELSDEDLERLVAYVSLLGLPGRRNADDPQVQRGEEVFEATGCTGCHVRETFTADVHPLVELRDQTIRPFSDLLLHDMGEGLADPQGGPLAREWRTAPLWGIGLVDDVNGHTRLLHDGRARNFLEAILWHGGEAAFASAAVKAMPTADREALLAFLGSL